jgi:DNA-binding MarR family transcriptional regulator
MGAIAIEDSPPFAGSSGRTMAWLTREFTTGLAQVDLSPTQYRMLILLSRGEAGSSALASYLAVSPPSVTSVVDVLVSRGLVDRVHDKGDRRRISLGLTEEGASLLALADQAADAIMADVAASSADVEMADRLLATFELWGEALTERRRVKQAAKIHAASETE